MKAGDVRSMTSEELLLAERNTAEELWKMQFQHHTGQLSNTSALGETRKRLARIRTIKNERRLGISAAPGEATDG